MPVWNEIRFIAYLRTYVFCVALASVLWESAQMPLYTLWVEGTSGELVVDILWCTAANIVIAVSSLAMGFTLTLRAPRRRTILLIVATCTLGVGYTIYSELMNVYVRGTWAYSDLMPILPGLEVGVAPLLQWLVLPCIGIVFAERTVRR